MNMTLREVIWATEAKIELQEFHAACIQATIANCHRDTKKRKKPYIPQDFMRKKAGTAKQKPMPAPIESLKLLL